jgi:hypothetical protein
MSEINRRKFTVLGGTALTASLLTAGQVFAKMTQGVQVNKPIDQLEAG